MDADMQDLEQLILESNAKEAQDRNNRTCHLRNMEHCSEYQKQFVAFLDRNAEPDVQDVHLRIANSAINRHHETTKGRTNTVLSQHRVNQHGTPYLIYGEHTSKMPQHANKTQLTRNKNLAATKSTEIKFDHIIETHKYSHVHNKQPTFMSPAEFALCAQHVKLQLNSKAVTTLNVDIDIPNEVLLILSYGPKFALPLPMSEDNATILMNAISALNIHNFAVYECNTLMAMAKYHIKNLNDIKSRTSDDMQRFLVHSYNCMLRFFQIYPHLMMAQSDKGSISIIMPKREYIQKMDNLLSDCTVYDSIKTSSHNGHSIRNEILLKQLAETGAISPEQIPDIVNAEQRIANIYGLIKLHKDDKPLRPVVNTRQTPGYQIAKIITHTLGTARDIHKYNIRNSTDLITRINRIQLEPTDFLATIDISNMFTNINTEAAIRSVTKRHREAKITSNIPLKLIIDCIRFVIQYATEIEFNGKLFKQKRGLRMGGSLSTILADFVIEDLFEMAFRSVPRPKFLTKYIDDCLMAAKRHILCAIIDEFNAQDEALEFIATHENEQSKLVYLNLELHNKHNLDVIYTSWYCKPFASGRLVNFNSSHPRTTIFNTMKAYITQMFVLTHHSMHDSITGKAREILAANNFPLHIAATMIKRIKQSLQNPADRESCTILTEITDLQNPYNRSIDSPLLKERQIYAPLPHFQHISDKIQKEMKLMKPNIKTIGTPVHTLRNINNQHKNLKDTNKCDKQYIMFQKENANI